MISIILSRPVYGVKYKLEFVEELRTLTNVLEPNAVCVQGEYHRSIKYTYKEGGNGWVDVSDDSAIRVGDVIPIEKLKVARFTRTIHGQVETMDRAFLIDEEILEK